MKLQGHCLLEGCSHQRQNEVVFWRGEYLCAEILWMKFEPLISTWIALCALCGKGALMPHSLAMVWQKKQQQPNWADHCSSCFSPTLCHCVLSDLSWLQGESALWQKKNFTKVYECMQDSWLSFPGCCERCSFPWMDEMVNWWWRRGKKGRSSVSKMPGPKHIGHTACGWV